MKRILIMGCPGSGKSTLARAISERLDIPAVHLDALFWQPGWKQTDAEEFAALQVKHLSGTEWVADGNYQKTLETRLRLADTIIYLNFPTRLCLYRIIQRRFMYRGKPRPDMASGCSEKIDWEFFQYVRTFSRKKGPALMARLQKETQNKNIYYLHSVKEIEAFLAELGQRSG